jgi:hypothetical protein
MVDLRNLGPSALVIMDALATLRLPRPRPVHPAIVSTRAAIEATPRGTLRLADDGLPRSWRWRGHGERVDVRYALYRLAEMLDEATVTAMRAVAILGERRAEAGQILSQATLARWDLHGLLLALTDDDLDRPPGGEEWTLRETLGPVAQTRSRYPLNTAYWALAAPSHDTTPAAVPDTPLTLKEDNAAWSAGRGPARQGAGPDGRGGR